MKRLKRLSWWNWTSLLLQGKKIFLYNPTWQINKLQVLSSNFLDEFMEDVEDPMGSWYYLIIKSLSRGRSFLTYTQIQVQLFDPFWPLYQSPEMRLSNHIQVLTTHMIRECHLLVHLTCTTCHISAQLHSSRSNSDESWNVKQLGPYIS